MIKKPIFFKLPAVSSVNVYIDNIFPFRSIEQRENAKNRSSIAPPCQDSKDLKKKKKIIKKSCLKTNMKSAAERKVKREGRGRFIITA